MTKWTPDDMPKLDGLVAVVTGASSGIGEASAEALAARGAEVVLAVRNAAKGNRTRDAILRRNPAARVSLSLVDLADLATVREFADRTNRALPQIDILINNAGLGLQPKRTTTKDGFELQFGTNYLGHFALTGLLLPALLRSPQARIVTISSIAHRGASIAFDDLQGERRYSGVRAYGQSKLADLIFAFELERRASVADASMISVAAHPGFSATGFFGQANWPKPLEMVASLGARVIGQNAEQGAWPMLFAASMPKVESGQYFGPDGIGEVRGRPTLASAAPQARDQAVAKRLWAVSEELTGVNYRLLEKRGNL